MNSFVPFSPNGSKFIQSLNNFPRISIAQPFAPNSPYLEVPKLPAFFGLPVTYSPTNGALSTANNSVSLSPINGFSPLKQSQAPVSPNLNLLMMMKLQQNIQAEVFKAQMQQLAELKSSLLEQLNQQNMQVESSSSPVQKHVEKMAAEPQSTVKVEVGASQVSQKIDQTAQKKGLKAQIKDIVAFVLDNFGRVSESAFDEEKQKYNDNKDLVTVFELLNAKYASTIKTKEEMVKYTLRRAFKFIKSSLKKQTQANTKGVSKTMCNKYFKASEEEIAKIGNEEDFLKVVLPFRKNSKNKTMNTTFINEVFASEEFCRDYERYLESFEAILEADNRNKVERLVMFIEECLTKKKLGDIKGYKRIPWPKLWITNTKNIAQSLPTLGAQSPQSPSESTKKVKKGGDFGVKRSFEDDCDSQISTDSHSTN